MMPIRDYARTDPSKGGRLICQGSIHIVDYLRVPGTRSAST